MTPLLYHPDLRPDRLQSRTNNFSLSRSARVTTAHACLVEKRTRKAKAARVLPRHWPILYAPV